MTRTEIEPHVLLSYKTKWFNSFWKYNEDNSKMNQTGVSNSSLTGFIREKNNPLSNLNLIDRKNFSVSITNSKENNKTEEKSGLMNKNYTFQYNSEAKKIISNIHNEGIKDQKIRASLGINISKPLTEEKEGNIKLQPVIERMDFKKSLKKNNEDVENLKIPEVIIIEESNTESKNNSNLFELGHTDSNSKKSPKFLESQVSNDISNQPISTDKLSFRVNSQENIIVENKSENFDQRKDNEDESLTRVKSSNLNLSLEDFKKVEKIVYKESQKIENQEEKIEKNETKEVEKKGNKRIINGIEIEGFEDEEEGEMDDFEKHFLGDDNDLGNFWDPEDEAGQEKGKNVKDEEELSMRSEMSIDNAIEENFAKAKEMTVTENLSHLKLEDVMKLETMKGPDIMKDDLFGLNFEASEEDDKYFKYQQEEGFKKN
jgi:hypothetical protein